MDELLRRLLACKHWRWRSFCGALTQAGVRVEEGMWPRDWEFLEKGGWGGPDLSDPATLGCLLHLVRKVYGDPKAYAGVNGVSNPGDDNHWAVWAWRKEDGISIRGYGATETEALIEALEVANCLIL